jgi:hypothetical protein
MQLSWICTLLHMLNETDEIGCTNAYAKAKTPLPFLTVVVFFLCCYSVFDLPSILEFVFLIRQTNCSHLFSLVKWNPRRGACAVYTLNIIISSCIWSPTIARGCKPVVDFFILVVDHAVLSELELLIYRGRPEFDFPVMWIVLKFSLTPPCSELISGPFRTPF